MCVKLLTVTDHEGLDSENTCHYEIIDGNGYCCGVEGMDDLGRLGNENQLLCLPKNNELVGTAQETIPWERPECELREWCGMKK